MRSYVVSGQGSHNISVKFTYIQVLSSSNVKSLTTGTNSRKKITEPQAGDRLRLEQEQNGFMVEFDGEGSIEVYAGYGEFQRSGEVSINNSSDNPAKVKVNNSRENPLMVEIVNTNEKYYGRFHGETVLFDGDANFYETVLKPIGWQRVTDAEGRFILAESESYSRGTKGGSSVCDTRLEYYDRKNHHIIYGSDVDDYAFTEGQENEESEKFFLNNLQESNMPPYYVGGFWIKWIGG